MSKYASLLFPPENFHVIGPFRFPVYHDLVPGEAKAIEAISRKQAKSAFKSIKLAQRIAKDRSITTKEAVELLSSAETEERKDLLYDYADELEAMQLNEVGAVEQQVAFVTVFMQYRSEAKLPEEDSWHKLDDWGQQDTEAIPTTVMEQIFQLILWERDGWPEPSGKSPNALEAPEASKTPSQKSS
jgi:hypothetical protein